jgi:hypothetical protein
MSISSSLPPSTRHTVRGGASHLRSSHAFRRRCRCRPWRRRPQCCQVHAHRHSTVHRWPATRRRTSGRRSTAIKVGRTVAPPSSATARGVKTSRVATSRETSTCMHQWVRANSHMHLSPLAPQEFWGGAWRWPNTCVWWSSRPSSDPTCHRSTTGWSTPPTSCRSTPPPSSRQAGMRLSWPTTSP